MTGTTRVVIDVDAMEWTPFGMDGLDIKVLRINDNYSYIDLFRAKGGIIGGGHVHIGEAEIYFLEGEVETIAGAAGKGYWVHEPAGAMHRASKSFVGERTLVESISLNHVNGPIAMLNPDGTAGAIMFGQSLKAAITGDSKRLSGADLTEAMYREDYDSGIVDTAALDWAPSAYDGVSIKVMKVYEHGRFTVIVKAEDGAVIPIRRYTAPADFFILSGCIKFEDGVEASSNFWVYEPMGAAEGAVTHIGETVYIATFLGAAIDLAADGSVERVVDGDAIQRLWDEAALQPDRQ
ncbi:cupin domain-containing protein [Sphingobium sp. HWE2-09]|uniref:cupin domain-containing protein n=1 Tax=Sphingobium sp. HWE2-09 TaxID=3108390 RepID=UPI002DC077AB|nr:hypothetical protein [Sphingobium sp. HWE2-09]